MIDRIKTYLPSRSALAAILVSFALGALVAGYAAHREVNPPPSTPTAPLTSQGFARLGATYTANLGKVYASAWEAGAASLEAGKPVAASLDAVREAWDRDRLALYRRFVSPEFGKVVPEGKAEAEITAARHAELAKAWRSFAAGLRK